MTSVTVRLLTLARDLRRRRARERHDLFVAEGVRTVEELLGAGLAVRGVLAAPALRDAERGLALLDLARARGVAVHEVDAADFASAASTEAPQGVLAVAEVPRRALADLDVAPGRPLLVLDAVQDPGNVGTMVRTAAAFGAAGVVALPGTVDLWNPKVVRSAMGALFRLPALPAPADALASFLRERDVPLWGADMHGEPLGRVVAPSRVAVAVGNEGAGLTDEVRLMADRLVSIPIAADVESLNVAVAAGILLHQLRA